MRLTALVCSLLATPFFAQALPIFETPTEERPMVAFWWILAVTVLSFLICAIQIHRYKAKNAKK